MTRRRHAGKADESAEEAEGGMERWLLTYADMITLLLALFILLFSVSTINERKFQALALGLRQTFDPKPGVLPASNGVLANANLTKPAGEQTSQDRNVASLPTEQATSSTTTPPASKASQRQLEQIAQQVDAALAARGLSGTVTTTVTRGELTVQVLADKVFFATDSADLGAVGDEVVDTVAGVLRRYPNLVDVDGYTDDQPITGGPFSSNEELSAVRAVNVVRRLSGVDGLDPSRLAATGFGDTHPVAPNDTPAHMALNRRIDIVVLSTGRGQP